MATTEHAGAAPGDAAEAQARIRRGWEEALTLPLSDDDRAAVERLHALSGCPVCLHLGDEGLYQRIDRLRAQGRPGVSERPIAEWRRQWNSRFARPICTLYAGRDNPWLNPPPRDPNRSLWQRISDWFFDWLRRHAD